MNFATADPKATSNLILGLACVLLAGSAYALLAPMISPPPSPAAVQRTAQRTERTEAKKAMDALRETQSAQQAVASRTWSEDPAAMTGRIVTLTATLAKQRGVSWVRLQPPAKPTLGGPLEEYPYLLVVEGPFPKVAELERDLETPANRLAVNSFQATSSDPESNKVSASIGLVAHRVPAEVEETPKKK